MNAAVVSDGTAVVATDFVVSFCASAADAATVGSVYAAAVSVTVGDSVVVGSVSFFPHPNKTKMSIEAIKTSAIICFDIYSIPL